MVGSLACRDLGAAGEGELAHQQLVNVLHDLTDSLLWSTRLGADPIFQIDSNLGVTAAVAEMLLQSHNGVLRFLPGLPSQWSEGSVKGLRARGGFVVDMEWKEGKPTEVRILAKVGGICKVRFQDKLFELTTEAGESYQLKDFTETDRF